MVYQKDEEKSKECEQPDAVEPSHMDVNRHVHPLFWHGPMIFKMGANTVDFLIG